MNNYIFDFDGTLADSKQCSILATQAAFREMRMDVPSEQQILHYMGIPIEQSFKEMSSVPIEDSLFNQLLHYFRQCYKEIEHDTLLLFPHIKEVLRQLKEQHIDCYVVSSKKTDVLKRNLQTLEIDAYFKDCIGSDQVEHYKPHPDGILKLVVRYDLEATECVMIGDAIFDIQMGKAANCKTCAVTWGSHSKEKLSEEQPDFLIDDIPLLLNLNEYIPAR